MKELLIVKANVDRIFGIEKDTEIEKDCYKNNPRQLGPRNSSLYLGYLWSCHRRDEEEQRGSDGELFASSFKLVRSQKKVVKCHIEVLQNSNSNQKETRYKQKTCNAHSW